MKCLICIFKRSKWGPIDNGLNESIPGTDSDLALIFAVKGEMRFNEHELIATLDLNEIKWK